ncbi:MAG: hypothetical protein E7256_06195 [Lachnospiraceae bacterium]|nr:hypothetical protein [Lachnospiraceae bacterium]
MWKLSFLGISFFEIFYYFFIFSFFGWIYESLFVSIREKRWTNRGFLNGPIIPIYGAGATLLYIAFFNDRTVSLTEYANVRNITIIFLSGMILASILEYVTSYAMEKMFHAKWWDYSDYPLNIQGRISLRSSVFWGFLSVIMAEFIAPNVSKYIIDKIPLRIGQYAGYVIFVVFLGDFSVTVWSTLKLDQKLTSMAKLREELYEYVQGSRIYDLQEELRYKLNKSKAAEYLEVLRENVDRGYEALQAKYKKENNEQGMQEKKVLRLELERRMKEFTARYKEQKTEGLHELIHKRILRAFPNMKAVNREGVLKDYREKLRRKNKHWE